MYYLCVGGIGVDFGDIDGRDIGVDFGDRDIGVDFGGRDIGVDFGVDYGIGVGVGCGDIDDELWLG